MKNVFKYIVVLVIVSLLTPVSALAAIKKPVRLFYYKDSPEAWTSLNKNYKYIDILAPQAYWIDAQGELGNDMPATLQSFARAKKLKLMPLVVNQGFSKTVATTFLDNELLQDKAIQQMVTEGVNQGFYGWQIDFEQVDVSYRDKFNTFVAKMYKTLKAHHLALSVAVVAQVSNDPADYKNNLWQKLIGVYDYSFLAAHSDFISMMSYDDPQSPGPIASYDWLKKVIKYSLTQIPSNKFSLGVGLYYWKWNMQTGKLVGIGDFEGVQNTLKLKGSVAGYDQSQQAPYISYVVDDLPYMLWYENGTSFQKKLNLIKSYKLHGFSAWMLGQEVPSIFSTLKKN